MDTKKRPMPWFNGNRKPRKKTQRNWDAPDSSEYIIRITFKSRLSRDQVISLMKERMTAFSRLPGLVQKYYVETGEPHTYAGIFSWVSRESMDAFLKMPVKESIAIAYKTEREPEIEVMPVVARLRPQ